MRTPLHTCYSLSEKPGFLALRGGPHDIAVEHSPSILLRKQVSFDLDWTTEMTFDPSRPGEEAGTVVWLTATMFAALGLAKNSSGGMDVVYRRPVEGHIEVSRVCEAATIWPDLPAKRSGNGQSWRADRAPHQGPQGYVRAIVRPV